MLMDLVTECTFSHSRCQLQEQTSEQNVSEESDTIENNLLGPEKQTGMVILIISLSEFGYRRDFPEER
jgi:hypothetical protein